LIFEFRYGFSAATVALAVTIDVWLGIYFATSFLEILSVTVIIAERRSLPTIVSISQSPSLSLLLIRSGLKSIDTFPKAIFDFFFEP